MSTAVWTNQTSVTDNEDNTTPAFNYTVTLVHSTEMLPTQHPVAGIVLEAVTLCLVWLLAVVGNVLVCIVIHRSRRLQSTTNYFVISLSCSDIVLTSLCMPFVFGWVLSDGWVFGASMCKFIRFLEYLLPATTMFVLVAICADRFYTIIYPLSFKVTRGRAKQLVIGSWIAAGVLASPSLYYFYIDSPDGRTTRCRLFVENTWDGIVYVVSYTTIVFILSVILTMIGYTRVFRYIWRGGTGGRTFQRTMNPVPRAKVKMVKMIIVVNSVSIALMTPYFIIHLWHSSVAHDHLVARSVYIVAVWTYFATAVSKPVIYLWCNSNFRRGCKEVFCMSSMKCYRSNAYTITTTSKLAKRNHIGIGDSSLDYRRVESPSKTFDRATKVNNCTWPITNHTPSTYL